MNGTAAPHHQLHDAAMLDDLKDIVGAQKLVLLLDSLADEIDRRLIPLAEERDQLAKDAHVIVSVGGALGFSALSHACAELEAACLRQEDTAQARVAVAAAAIETRSAIKTLRSQVA